MTVDLAHQALYATYPAIKSFLSARIPDTEARDRVEHLVAGHHYIVGDAEDGQYHSTLQYGVVLGAVEGQHNIQADHLLASHNSAFDLIIESVIHELMASGGMQKHILHDIFKSDSATQLFIGCAKSFLLACTLKQSKGQRDAAEIAEQLRPIFFAEMASLEFLKRFHLDWIRQTIGPAKKCIAFYCPNGVHRARWARLPTLLQRNGYAVLLLYGAAHGDAFEMEQNAFYVGHGLIAQIDCVDLFLTESAMDGLPDRSKKALFVEEGSVFWPKQDEAFDGSILDQYRHALKVCGGLSAYFRVYDYFIATSAQARADLLCIAQAYGMATKVQDVTPHEAGCALPIDLFNMALLGRALPKQTCIISADAHKGEGALCELVAPMLRGVCAEDWECMENMLPPISVLL